MLDGWHFEHLCGATKNVGGEEKSELHPAVLLSHLFYGTSLQQYTIYFLTSEVGAVRK